MWKAKVSLLISRALCFWLDVLIVTPLCGALAWCLNYLNKNPGGFEFTALGWAWWPPLILFLYRIIFEATKQTSLGALLTGLEISYGKGNRWLLAGIRNSWLLLMAGVAASSMLLTNGAQRPTVENLIPVLLGVCILLWMKTPFDALAKTKVTKLSKAER